MSRADEIKYCVINRHCHLSPLLVDINICWLTRSCFELRLPHSRSWKQPQVRTVHGNLDNRMNGSLFSLFTNYPHPLSLGSKLGDPSRSDPFFLIFIIPTVFAIYTEQTDIVPSPIVIRWADIQM